MTGRMTSEATLEPLDRLVGTWDLEIAHPAFPGVVVHGSAVVEWLEGERFLIHRARTEHPDFPDSIAIIGHTEQDRVGDASGEARPCMHYFDSRGVFREYEVGIDDKSWRLHRNAPDFSQRFTGTFTDGGDTIVGQWQLCEDDVHWNDDLKITYRR
jgi:hypothetical protein